VGNNAAEIITAVIEGISAFRDELITPDVLGEYTSRGDNLTRSMMKNVNIFYCSPIS